jgi:glycosyltransferase involved in cell wall biosynthesis
VDIHNDKIEKDVILYVGWILPHKGIHVMLEAMVEVVKEIPSARLFIIETGKDNIQQLIRRYELESYVTVLGRVAPEDVKEYLQRANIVVIPEQWENVGPLFLVEAMNFAKPIVASSIGAIPEFIDDGQSGFLVEPNDSRAFAERIIWILKNRERAMEMGRNAYENAKRIFDKNKNLEQLLNLYKEKINELG